MRGHCQADGYDVHRLLSIPQWLDCVFRLEPEQTSRSDMRPILTERIFESALDCTYKCHLLLNGRHGNKTEYEEHTERLDNMYQRAAIAILQEMHPNKDIIFLHELTPDTFDNDARVFIIMHAEANGLKSDWIVLTRGKHTLGSYQPVLFHRGE